MPLKGLISKEMSSKYFVFYLVLLTVTWGCTSKSDKVISEIKQLEEEVYSMKMIDQQKAITLIDAYINYANEHPKDSVAGEFVYKAADISMNLNMADQAILYFDRFMAMYPDSLKVPECLFLKAFIYENQKNDLSSAEKYYKEFIEKYPNHTLVKDAKAALKYLGKSPEELIKIFQEQNS